MQKQVKRLRDGGIETRYTLARTLPWCNVVLQVSKAQRPSGVKQYAVCMTMGPKVR